MMPSPRRKSLQLYLQWNILLQWVFRHVTRDRTWGMPLNSSGIVTPHVTTWPMGHCFLPYKGRSYLKQAQVSLSHSLALLATWGLGFFPFFPLCPVFFCYSSLALQIIYQIASNGWAGAHHSRHLPHFASNKYAVASKYVCNRGVLHGTISPSICHKSKLYFNICF